MRVVWMQPALDDLDEIRRYIAARDPAAAERTIGRILRKVAMLGDLPGLGRAGRWRRTKELVVSGTPYVVPYRVLAGDVEVMRVLHGARQWPRRF